MTKDNVITKISEQTGLTKDDVSNVMETFFKSVKDLMADGNNIYIRGFGSFVNQKRARKIARNISKNQAMIIEEHYVPKFKPAPIFIEKVKKSFSEKVAA
jgi:DNA-binding protein HU-beta